MIDSQKSADKYFNKVMSHLDTLETLSVNAGMLLHASIWSTLKGVFYDSPEAIETIADMMMMYVKARLERGQNNADRKNE